AAFRDLESGLNSGFAPILRLAAYALLEGTYFDVDPKLAYGYLEQAANAGDKPAAVALALMTEAGLGVKANPTRAIELLRGAAEGGSGRAMHLLALRLESTDRAQAIFWHSQASERNIYESSTRLWDLED